MSTVSIAGLSKAAVLAALYNNSKVQGMGFLHATGKEMTVEEAQELIDDEGYQYDYLNGKVMKVNIEDDEMSTWGYDRDNGENAVQIVIDRLRETGNVGSLKGDSSSKEEMFEAMLQMMRK